MALFFGCFFASIVDASSLYQADEIVVTATRTNKALVDVPVRTEVISREQIERVHARDLKEALDILPGVILNKIHGKSGYSVWMQGIDSDGVLVLIDGEPVSASTGSTVDLTQISAAEIERVEVVKGASSALYGSSAMGGVVNVITRRAEKPLSWSVTADGGGWGDDTREDAGTIPFRHLAGNLSLHRGKWSFLANTDVRDSDGYDLDKSTFRTQGDKGVKLNVNTRVAYHPDESSEIYISPKHYREDIQNRISRVRPGVPGEILQHKNELATRSTLVVGGKKVFEDESRISAYVMAERFDDDTSQDVIATAVVELPREAEINTAKAELQWDKPVGENHVITSGISYFDETLDQLNASVPELIPNSGRHNVEVYAQDDIFLGDHYELVVGLRAQDDSDFGDYVAPKISLLYSPEWFDTAETRIRTSIGQGYRVPNLKERFFIFDHSANGYKVRGNPDLQPEESLSLQVGMEVIAVDRRFDINFFYNDIDNLIETDLAPVQDEPGIRLFDYINVNEARTQGMELSWGQQLRKDWQYSTAYTYLDAIDRATGNDLPDRAKHQIKTELRYKHQPWQLDISLFGTYQSEEFTRLDNNIRSPSWVRWDLKFNKKVAGNWSLFFGIDNLGDVHREERLNDDDNRPDEGRFYYAGMRLHG